MRYLSLLVIISLFSPALSQTKGMIMGTIKDKNTQELLPLVNILVENTTYGVTTDFDGKYKLEITSQETFFYSQHIRGYMTVMQRTISQWQQKSQPTHFSWERVPS